jgi:hypothetical protein
MALVVAIALLQGLVLYGLHNLAESEAGRWSELIFLLPAYAVTVGVPLTYYLLRSRLTARWLLAALTVVGLGLTLTATYVGWVNGPVGELRPAAAGAVFLYVTLAVLGWFVALPFLGLGLRGSLTAEGYTALFDESWRLAITLAFATVFVQLFWGLLVLFVGLFESIKISWPKDVIFKRNFYYPATCAAASFAIGLTDLKPEMFRSLRRLLLAVLRWLTVLAAAIVVLFLGALALRGVDPLWKTHFAAWGLISLSLALITLYNTVYQDGGERERLPRGLALPVRAALVVGPALAVLAFCALALRIGQHGVSEDRLLAMVVVTILAGFLFGYWVVAVAGSRAPFDIRHVNVVMALAIVATLLAIHSPLVDLKRVAAASQVARLGATIDAFDFRYLRFDLGRHGLRALQELAASDTQQVAKQARTALAEPNRTEYGLFAGRKSRPIDEARFLSRVEVFPEGRELPHALAEQLLSAHREKRILWCIDQGPACVALLVDLDDDGQEEVVLPLSFGTATVYARRAGSWGKVGQLFGQYGSPEDLRAALRQNRLRALPPARYHGLEIGKNSFVFTPCSSNDDQCADGQR